LAQSFKSLSADERGKKDETERERNRRKREGKNEGEKREGDALPVRESFFGPKFSYVRCKAAPRELAGMAAA
jgi:hypothetical protein